MTAFYIKRNDTSPSLLYALTPLTVDLTGAAVVFNMRNESGTVVISREAAVVVTATGTPTVRYDWQAGDTDTAGAYRFEFEVTYADDTVETFPNYSFGDVTISEDIA